MFESVDRDDQIFLFKDIHFSGPSLDVFIILSHFEFHSLTEQFNVSVHEVDIISQQFSDQFLDEKSRVDENGFFLLLIKNFSLQVFQVICYNRIVQISLRFKLLKIFPGYRAGVGKFSYFEGKLSFDMSVILITNDVHGLSLSFFLHQNFFLFLFVSFEEFIFTPGRHKVEFQVHDFILGLFINGDKWELVKKEWLLDRWLGRGFLLEGEFLQVDNSFLMLVVDELKNFVAIRLEELVELAVGLGDMPE